MPQNNRNIFLQTAGGSTSEGRAGRAVFHLNTLVKEFFFFLASLLSSLHYICKDPTSKLDPMHRCHMDLNCGDTLLNSNQQIESRGNKHLNISITSRETEFVIIIVKKKSTRKSRLGWCHS